MIESLWKVGDLGKTFNTNANDTFNAYAINSLHTRISTLEGKATNVSYTATQTSGTALGTLTIDGANKTIYAPTIPSSLKNPYSLTFGSKTYDGSAAREIVKGDLGLGNVENTALSTWKGTSNITTLGTITTGVWQGTKIANAYLANNSLTIAGNTIALGGTLDTATLQSSLGFSSLLSALSTSNNTNLSITVGGTTKTITGLYAKYTNFFADKWDYNSGETFDLNEWSSGGIVRCYGSSGNLLNKPEGFTYGSILALSNGYAALTGQLAWAVNHNSTTDTTKAMWFRVSDSANGYTYAKWHQIAFVDEVDTKLSSYLPLSGGTISGYNAFPLVIKSDTASQLVGFQQNNNTLADVGYYAGRGAMLRNKKGSTDNYISIKDDGTPTYNGNTLIHSGNIGSQSVADSDKLDGQHGSYYTPLFNKTVTKLTSADNLDDKTTGYYSYINANNPTNAIGDNTSVLAFGSSRNDDYHQLVFDGNTDRIYHRRKQGNTWFDYQQIAYISSNVASATKLKTARTIWGQSFDGSANVSGDLSLGSGAILSNNGHVMLSSNGYVLIGYETAANGYRTYIDGNDIYLRYGQSHTNGLILSNVGNVLIGTTTDSGYKLHVKSATTALMCESTTSESSIYFSASSENAYKWAIGKGVWNIGSDFGIGEYNTAQKLFFRIAKNGNVGIGLSYTTAPSYKLDVNGTLHASGAVTFDSTLASKSYHYIYDADKTNRLCMAWSGGTACIYSIKADGSGYNNLRIGVTATGNTRQLYLDYASGYWGVGTSTPQYKLDVNGVIHSNEGIFSDGYVSAKGQNTSSDMRLKNVLNAVVLGVKDIANAPSMRFAWKNGGGIDVGSSAQYWQNILPDAVKERDGKLEMQYANIALLSAIAIAKNVETHEERIVRLEKENEELRTKIDMMERGIA